MSSGSLLDAAFLPSPPARLQATLLSCRSHIANSPGTLFPCLTRKAAARRPSSHPGPPSHAVVLEARWGPGRLTAIELIEFPSDMAMPPDTAADLGVPPPSSNLRHVPGSPAPFIWNERR